MLPSDLSFFLFRLYDSIIPHSSSVCSTNTLSSDNELLRSERELRAEGFCWIAGVDEAGRGPLCGPVVAAAVVLSKDTVIEGLDDSKKLTEKKREKLYDEIIENENHYLENWQYIENNPMKWVMEKQGFE